MAPTPMKLNNKQKVAIADEIMFILAEHLTREEDLYVECLDELRTTREGLEAILTQTATWLQKLPGKNWNTAFPQPWAPNNDRVGYWIGDEWFKHED